MERLTSGLRRDDENGEEKEKDSLSHRGILTAENQRSLLDLPAWACQDGSMPKLTVEGYGTFDVPADKRLVLAIEQDAHVDILHACGGNARCTTCRVEFVDGEPSAMTEAERQVLAAKGVSGVRLSCQMLCDHDMTVRAISRLEGSGRPDPGRTPEPTITPPPVWT